MKIFLNKIKFFICALILLFPMSLSTVTVKAADSIKQIQPDNQTVVQPMNGITQYYRSYFFGKTGLSCSPSYGDYYFKNDAYNAIWNTSGSWKGFILRDSKGSTTDVANLQGVVLSYEASYRPIDIDFDYSYYQLAYGSSNNTTDFVIGVQQALIWLGYYIGPSGIDGDYGYNTEKAVIAFQKNHGLTQDGVVGKVTYWELSRALY